MESEDPVIPAGDGTPDEPSTGPADVQAINPTESKMSAGTNARFSIWLERSMIVIQPLRNQQIRRTLLASTC